MQEHLVTTQLEFTPGLAFMARKGFLGRAEKTGRLSKSVTYDDKLVLSALQLWIKHLILLKILKN